MHPSIEQYLTILHTRRRAPATLKVVRQDLTHFVRWWEQTRRRAFDPALLGHEDLRDWQVVRQRDDGAAPATINRGLASLRGYCQWATMGHPLTENPVVGLQDVPADPLNGLFSFTPNVRKADRGFVSHVRRKMKQGSMRWREGFVWNLFLLA